jgi:hypothetical protein
VQELNSRSFEARSKRHADEESSAFQTQVHQAAQRADVMQIIDAEYMHEDEPLVGRRTGWTSWVMSRLEVPLKAESVLAPSGYSVDTYHPKHRVAIEADGPLHFFACERTLRRRLNGTTAYTQWKINGKTALKHWLLRKHGYAVISVSSYDWQDSRDCDYADIFEACIEEAEGHTSRKDKRTRWRKVNAEAETEWEIWERELEARDQQRLDNKRAEITQAKVEKEQRQEKRRLVTALAIQEQQEEARLQTKRLEAEQTEQKEQQRARKSRARHLPVA